MPRHMGKYGSLKFTSARLRHSGVFDNACQTYSKHNQICYAEAIRTSLLVFKGYTNKQIKNGETAPKQRMMQGVSVGRRP